MATRDPGEPQGSGAPVHPGEARDLDRDVDPAHPYRARQLAPYRRDAGLHDSGLTGRYPGLRGSGSRDPRVHSSGPRCSTPASRSSPPWSSASSGG